MMLDGIIFFFIKTLIFGGSRFIWNITKNEEEEDGKKAVIEWTNHMYIKVDGELEMELKTYTISM